ncbi:MAG: prolipoprotein diacylglyceryl transferase [Oscillospiraceae bacterium]|nr:prolipoprotein diacylglyceryl transferase [Oscillospiraceae bacterium]
MAEVALLYQGQFVYWRSILWALAALAAIFMAVALRLWQRKPLAPLLIALPFALVLSVLCARLIHWYCSYESYASLGAALGNLRGGGYSLLGVFAGTALSLALLRLLGLTDNLPGLLDALSPAAAFGIALGRWAELFTSADRGKMILEAEALHRLPFSVPVVNAGGLSEWRFATFAFQSIWAGIVFLILLLRFLIPGRMQEQRRSWREGNVFCLFLLLYGCGQVLLDSTRYDALYLRSNGFVSLVQIACAAALIGVTALYSVRSIRVHGFHWYHPALWLLALLGLGLAGVMEWFVQRHGDEYVLAYGLMLAGLLLYVCAPLYLARSTRTVRRKPSAKQDILSS